MIQHKVSVYEWLCVPGLASQCYLSSMRAGFIYAREKQPCTSQNCSDRRSPVVVLVHQEASLLYAVIYKEMGMDPSMFPGEKFILHVSRAAAGMEVTSACL